ncbi:MAG: hypothetical protein ACYDBI_06150 [Thermoplasmataceae archaeon]
MRTYGRNYNSDGTYTWVEVTTDAAGFNDEVWLTTLCQVVQLNLGESPFFGNSGLPQYQTIVTQIFPDYYVTLLQEQFSQYFASLAIARQPNTNPPVYEAQVMTHSGAILSRTIPT